MIRLILDISRTSPSPRSSGSWTSKKTYQLLTCIKNSEIFRAKVSTKICYVNLMICQIELLLICSVSFMYHATGVSIMDVFYSLIASAYSLVNEFPSLYSCFP